MSACCPGASLPMILGNRVNTDWRLTLACVVGKSWVREES
jgi:hypothetical protein